MASKKEWKGRAKSALFAQQQAERRADHLQEQLNKIDNLLNEAQFPGPTLPEWAGQVRGFLQTLARLRGRSEPREERIQHVDLADIQPDGIFTLPTMEEIRSRVPRYYPEDGKSIPPDRES